MGYSIQTKSKLTKKAGIDSTISMTNKPDLDSASVIKVVHVVAMDNARCIGQNNQLAWHIPADLQHFKTITSGGVVVMGRKTFESIGRPLPNRINHVITRDKTWQAGGITISHSLDDALAKVKIDTQNRIKGDGVGDISKQPNHQTAIYIIGGGEIYQQTLDIADVLEITHVDLCINGDAYYPDFTDKFTKVWQSEPMHETTGIGFYFARYERIIHG